MTTEALSIIAPRRSPLSWARSVGTLLVLPVVVTAIWWLLAVLVPSAVLPTPLESMQGLAKDLSTESYRASILVTVRLLLIAWVLSVVIGGLAGFILGLSSFWSRVFSTPLFAIYSLPLVTLYPVFMLATGIGEPTRVIFAFAHGVIPMALLVMGAARNIDRNLLRLGDALVLSRWGLLRKIVIPALLPTIATAARMAFGLTVIGLLLAGMITSTSGLGHELVNNIANVRMSRITGQVVFIIVLAVVPGLLLRYLEQRVTARYSGQ